MEQKIPLKRNRARVPGSLREIAARLCCSHTTIRRRKAQGKRFTLKNPQALAPMVPAVGQVKLSVRPCTLKQANDLVTAWHRHHYPVVSHRFSLRVEDEQGNVHGACIVSRPAARHTDQFNVCEVARLVTDGTQNACSALYGAAAKTARAMGFERIQTFVLESEPGTSLKATGWSFDGITDNRRNRWGTRPGRRRDQPEGTKQRWIKVLNQR
jgi:hypothetical protein